MTIAKTVDNYLRSNNVAHFGLIEHDHSGCTSEAAQKAHVSGHCVAKGIVIHTGKDYALVVIPATHNVSVARLREAFGEEATLASESELRKLFPDCEIGAVPAVGMAYEVPTYVDEVLFEQPEVYFEGGDHESLIELSRSQFMALFSSAQTGNFGVLRH